MGHRRMHVRRDDCENVCIGCIYLLRDDDVQMMDSGRTFCGAESHCWHPVRPDWKTLPQQKIWFGLILEEEREKTSV